MIQRQYFIRKSHILQSFVVEIGVCVFVFTARACFSATGQPNGRSCFECMWVYFVALGSHVVSPFSYPSRCMCRNATWKYRKRFWYEVLSVWFWERCLLGWNDILIEGLTGCSVSPRIRNIFREGGEETRVRCQTDTMRVSHGRTIKETITASDFYYTGQMMLFLVQQESREAGEVNGRWRVHC